MSRIHRRPNFITVEGIDGVGKSTVVATIADYLNDIDINTQIVRQNKDTVLARKVREFISCKEAYDTSSTTFALLFAASINDSIEKIIEPAHLSGKVVISDRYTMSTRVYQRDSKYIDKICDILENQLMPDLIFVLDAPPSVVKARIIERDEETDALESADDEKLNGRRKEFLKIARTHVKNTYTIDASGTQESVAEQIVKILSSYYNR